MNEHPRVTRERIAARANCRMIDAVVAIEVQKKAEQQAAIRARLAGQIKARFAGKSSRGENDARP